MLHVQLQDESGLILNDYGRCDVLPALLKIADNRATTCLRFIDPQGVTIFNQLQIPVLLEELTVLQRYCKTDTDRQQLKGLLQFVKHCNEAHTYIEFVGNKDFHAFTS